MKLVIDQGIKTKEKISPLLVFLPTDGKWILICFTGWWPWSVSHRPERFLPMLVFSPTSRF